MTNKMANKMANNIDAMTCNGQVKSAILTYRLSQMAVILLVDVEVKDTAWLLMSLKSFLAKVLFSKA